MMDMAYYSEQYNFMPVSIKKNIKKIKILTN